MSLIEREKLIAEYDKAHVGPPGGARKLMEDAPAVKPGVVAEIKIDNDALQRMVDEAVEQIRAELFRNQAPTIEPRTKGVWIEVYDSSVGGHNSYSCSNCGLTIVTNPDYLKKHKFCFACGADMRERNDGEDD